MATLTFLGATGTVTGSRYLVEIHGHRYLVDAGLFQGEKELRLRNWEPFPVDPASIEAVILTHAHIDHTGYLPRLVRDGFRGDVYVTPPTKRLLAVLLPDAAHLQEEEARYANKVGSTKHKPALPLFDSADASQALALLRTVPFDHAETLHPGCTFVFHRQGHILGAAAVELTFKNRDGERTSVYFSGDVGRYAVPILEPPTPFPGATYLVVESTYGDRVHEAADPRDQLAEVIASTSERGGVVLIPAFAVGRTQEILYYLRDLENDGFALPPIYLDSPMAREATTIYRQANSEHDAETRMVEQEEGSFLPSSLSVVATVKESQSLNNIPGPAIVISASGMATGGRILHHLRHRLPHPQNTVLFVGFQAKGTRGRSMLEGEPTVKIFGEHVPVRAQVASIASLSAHADREELLVWMRQSPAAPQRVFITHGEPAASQKLAELIEKELGWPCHFPQFNERVSL